MPLLKREPDLFPDDLLSTDHPVHPWQVLQTRSRQEKALARSLREAGIGYYLPAQERRVRRAGKHLVSFVPLFPGYVFLSGTAADRLYAFKTHRTVRTLPVADPEALHCELRSLRTLTLSGAPISPHRFLAPGDRIRVVSGPFQGVVGTVVRARGRLRLVVSVSFLRAAVSVELSREDVDLERSSR